MIFMHFFNKCKRAPDSLTHWYMGWEDTTLIFLLFWNPFAPLGSCSAPLRWCGRAAGTNVPMHFTSPCTSLWGLHLVRAWQLCKQCEVFWRLRTKWGLSGDLNWSASQRISGKRLQRRLPFGAQCWMLLFWNAIWNQIYSASTLALNWSSQLPVTWRVQLGSALGAVFSISAERWMWAEPGICLKEKGILKKFFPFCFISSHFLPTSLPPPFPQTFNNLENHRFLQEKN